MVRLEGAHDLLVHKFHGNDSLKLEEVWILDLCWEHVGVMLIGNQ